MKVCVVSLELLNKINHVIKRTSIEHIKAKEKHDLDRQQWKRIKVINGKEWLTEWGAGLLLAEGIGINGYEARDAADNRQIQYESNGRLNREIRDAINGGELPAISEFRLSAIKPQELGSTSVLIKKSDFIAWVSVSYPAFEWVESEGEFKPQIITNEVESENRPIKNEPEQSQQDEDEGGPTAKISQNDILKNTVQALPTDQPTELEPILKTRDTEGQKKWIEYHV